MSIHAINNLQLNDCLQGNFFSHIIENNLLKVGTEPQMVWYHPHLTDYRYKDRFGE